MAGLTPRVPTQSLGSGERIPSRGSTAGAAAELLRLERVWASTAPGSGNTRAARLSSAVASWGTGGRRSVGRGWSADIGLESKGTNRKEEGRGRQAARVAIGR